MKRAEKGSVSPIFAFEEKSTTDTTVPKVDFKQQDFKWAINRDGHLVVDPPPKYIKNHWAAYRELSTGKYGILNGGFLKLGDASADPELFREQVLNENNTIAFPAALISAVIFGFWTMAPFDEEAMSQGLFGKPLGNFLIRSTTPWLLITGTILVLSIFQAIMMILAVNEMSGKGEVSALMRKLGLRANGAFATFQFGTVIFAGWAALYALAFTQRYSDFIITCIVMFMVILSVWMIYPGIYPLVAAMSNVKAELQDASAIVLTPSEIKQHIQNFEEIIAAENPKNKWLISPANLKRYIETIDARMNNGRVPGLAWSTTMAIEKIFEGRMDEFMKL